VQCVRGWVSAVSPVIESSRKVRGGGGSASSSTPLATSSYVLVEICDQPNAVRETIGEENIGLTAVIIFHNEQGRHPLIQAGSRYAFSQLRTAATSFGRRVLSATPHTTVILDKKRGQDDTACDDHCAKRQQSMKQGENENLQSLPPTHVVGLTGMSTVHYTGTITAVIWTKSAMRGGGVYELDADKYDQHSLWGRALPLLLCWQPRVGAANRRQSSDPPPPALQRGCRLRIWNARAVYLRGALVALAADMGSQLQLFPPSFSSNGSSFDSISREEPQRAPSPVVQEERRCALPLGTQCERTEYVCPTTTFDSTVSFLPPNSNTRPGDCCMADTFATNASRTRAKTGR
jgi:hypothetical protein